MEDAKKLADISGHFADPARAAMVLSLMDGAVRSTADLQLAANVSASSASMHLSKLVGSRILTVLKQGRVKYYRISNAVVAHAVESLTIAASPASAIRQIARSPVNPFAFARTCYDHLAGRIGVEVTNALQAKAFLVPTANSYELTEEGSEWMNSLGIDCAALRSQRRQFAPQCLDYTERRSHLAGALGAALLLRMIELNWFARSRVPRALRLTVQGKIELGKRLNINIP